MAATGLYVHIPFCPKKCDYCAFYSQPIIEPAKHQKFLDALKQELEARLIATDTVDTIFIGGGSPSILNEKLISLAGDLLTRFSSVEEFTVELNPAHVTESLLTQLKQANVNRISIGVQSFVESELNTLGRNATLSQSVNALEVAKKHFDNVNIDLIFAIPGQTCGSLEYSLETALSFNPEHISAYSLIYETDSILKQKLDSGVVEKTSQSLDRQMYYQVIDTLAAAGLEQYEISNFAKPSYQCKHNIKYWQNKNYLGIGPAAGSFYHRSRTMNIADTDKYIERISANQSPFVESAKPTDIEFACETAVLNLRLTAGVNLEQYKKQTSYDFSELFKAPLQKYIADGLILQNKNNIKLSRGALAIADSIVCDFSEI